MPVKFSPDDIARFNKAAQEEAQKPDPAGTLHAAAARLVFSWSESPTGRHSLFQVEKDADGMWACSHVLASFLSRPLLDVCVQELKQEGWAWVPPDSNLLRKAAQMHEVSRSSSARLRRLLTRHQTVWIDPSTVTAITPCHSRPGESIVFHVGPVTVLGNPDQVHAYLFGTPADLTDALSVPLAATPAEAFSGEGSEP